MLSILFLNFTKWLSHNFIIKLKPFISSMVMSLWINLMLISSRLMASSTRHVYTQHKQNIIAEYKNRHLNMHVPRQLWAEIVMTIVFLIKWMLVILLTIKSLWWYYHSSTIIFCLLNRFPKIFCCAKSTFNFFFFWENNPGK